MKDWDWSDEQSDALWLLAPIRNTKTKELEYDSRYEFYYRIVYGGAAYGGKSTLISAWLDMMCLNFPGTRYYLGRDTLKDIKESVLLTYFDWCKQNASQIRYVEQKSKITYRNGSEIFLLETFDYPSDPNFDRFGSREYTGGAIEEGVTTSKRASNLLLSRTRFKHIEYNLKPKQLITLNPGDGWIKDEIVMPTFETGKALRPFDIFVKATIQSNPNKEAAKAYEKTLTETNTSYDLARLLNGDWNARPKSGAEFLKEFSQEKHVKKGNYDPALPLHISFDENVHPHITALIFQIQTLGDMRHCVQLAEVCQPPPLNSRKKVCETICEKYEHHIGGMYVYGDATSLKNDTAKEYGENFFTDILLYLKKFRPTLRVSKANPPVKSSGGFVNIILEKTFRNLKIVVDPSCKLSISDYCFAMEDADGGVLKKRITNPETGISYEKNGHHVDALRYFICEAFMTDFYYYLSGGQESNYEVGADRETKFNR